MSYTEADVDRLGAHLNGMELDAGERAALHALITFASRYPADLEGLRFDDDLTQALHRVLFELALV